MAHRNKKKKKKAMCSNTQNMKPMRVLTDCVSTQNMTTQKHAADDKQERRATQNTTTQERLAD